MKAVIFNSGLGNRMGDFTKNNHKSMARLKDGETIFHRQLRMLSAEGIKDFIVTTGPFEDQLKAEAADFPELNFTFVRNDIYDKTNYIYSMYLAREYMNDDLVFLHGDLVFNRKLVHDVLNCEEKNTATVNFKKALPEKDFKGRVKDGKVVGAILCGHDGRRGCLYHVCVDPQYRKQGIGTAMVVFAMNALKKEKISKVSLIAFTQNDIGNAFWRKIGWTQRLDLNYYDFTLNTENIIRFNQ